MKQHQFIWLGCEGIGFLTNFICFIFPMEMIYTMLRICCGFHKLTVWPIQRIMKSTSLLPFALLLLLQLQGIIKDNELFKETLQLCLNRRKILKSFAKCWNNITFFFYFLEILKKIQYYVTYWDHYLTT